MVVSFPSSLYYIMWDLSSKVGFYRSKTLIADLKNHYTKREERSFFYLGNIKKDCIHNHQGIKELQKNIIKGA